MSKVRDILKGIDKQQIHSNDGWWETSEQAKFGVEKLQEVEALFNELLEALENMIEINDRHQEAWSNAKVAIAKAKGE